MRERKRKDRKEKKLAFAWVGALLTLPLSESSKNLVSHG